MKDYIKKVWKLLVWGLALGLTLTILLEHVPIRFMLSVMIFVVIVGEFVEWEKTLTGFNELVKKVTWLSAGVIVFVWSRAIVGFFMDQPSIRAYEDIASGGGALYLHKNSWTTNMMFELLYLPPGLAVAYLVIKGGLVWKIASVLCSTILLVWVSWTMQQPPHAQAIKRQAQAWVSLNARGRTHNALVNTAAAVSSYGLAKEPVAVFYQLNGGTNMVKDLSLTNRVLALGEQVLRPNPEEPPFFYQGMTFVRVVLKNPDGSFLNGYSAWVEVRQFDWVDGNITAAPAKATPQQAMTGRTFTVTLRPNEKYEVDKVRQGQRWSFPTFTGQFQSRVDTGDDSACWETVENTLPWKAEKSGSLQIRTGQAGATVTVNVQN